ncbi:hypothetical protein STEG23_024466, partial [Scotinomys teguina]
EYSPPWQRLSGKTSLLFHISLEAEDLGGAVIHERSPPPVSHFSKSGFTPKVSTIS